MATNDSISTADSIRRPGGLRVRIVNWLLLTGNRFLIAGAVVVAVFVLTYALIATGVFAVGPNGLVATVFASGLIAGTLTLMGIALSINQLLLSRVFGTPNDLLNRIDGARTLRERVRTRAGTPTTPNDPAAFLATIGRALRDHALALEAAVEATERTAPEEVEDYTRAIREYGESIDEQIDPEMDVFDALSTVMGTEYAVNLTATERLQHEFEASLTERASDELDAIDDLLESVAVTRQFFKTVSVQQNFARLSRLLAYSGFLALAVSVGLPLVYRTNTVTIPPQYLPVAVSLGIATVVTPLSFFLAYVVRAATVARRTVSAGPFVPPESRQHPDEE